MVKLVMTDGSSLLGYEEKEMIVVFRMNRYYMFFMREHYGEHILKIQSFGMTVFAVTNKAQELQ